MTEARTDPTDEPLTKREMENELIIQALVEGATQVEAARIAGVSERTVRRRFNEPEFVKEYHGRRRVVLDVTRGRLVALHGVAVDTIEDLMVGAKSEHVRMATAFRALDSAPHVESEDLSDRITALEAKIEADGGAAAWTSPSLLGDLDDPAEE